MRGLLVLTAGLDVEAGQALHDASRTHGMRLGGAVVNLRVAPAHAGWHPYGELLPDSPEPVYGARLSADAILAPS